MSLGNFYSLNILINAKCRYKVSVYIIHLSVHLSSSIYHHLPYHLSLHHLSIICLSTHLSVYISLGGCTYLGSHEIKLRCQLGWAPLIWKLWERICSRLTHIARKTQFLVLAGMRSHFLAGWQLLVVTSERRVTSFLSQSPSSSNSHLLFSFAIKKVLCFKDSNN